MQLALLRPKRKFMLSVRIQVGVVRNDKALQGETLHHNEPRHPHGARAGCAVVHGHGAAAGDAALLSHGKERGLENRPTGVVEIRVDTLGGRGREGLRQGSALISVIKAFIKAQRVANPSAFFRTTGHTNDPCAFELSELTHEGAHGACRRRHQERFPGMNARGLEESVVGRLSRDAQKGEVMGQGAVGADLAERGPRHDRVALPADIAVDQFPRGESRVLRSQHLSDSTAGHYIAGLHRPPVSGALQPSAVGRILGDQNDPDGDLPRFQRGKHALLEAKVPFLEGPFGSSSMTKR